MALVTALALTTVRPALAFTHIVRAGETLASIAEAMYGRIQYEQILVAANGLDVGGGIPIVPGMRLEIPAVSHRRLAEGDTWAELAKDLLGGAHRADVLAMANGSYPWLPPEVGAEIVVPYNLRIVATGAETIVTLAYRYLGNKEKAWTLDHYNARRGKALSRGDVILVPLVDLPLTEAGKQAAAHAATARRSEGAGGTRSAQLEVDREIVALVADVRGGRYVDAVRRGSAFLAKGELSRGQLAVIHRQLLDAYVALDAVGLAKQSCREWRANDPNARLDRRRMSPKLLEVCD
jgi:hypothetical protein